MGAAIIFRQFLHARPDCVNNQSTYHGLIVDQDFDVVGSNFNVSYASQASGSSEKLCFVLVIGEVLRPVQGATYQGSKFLVQCHQGTRKDVIKALQDWVDLDGQPPICWLSGPAGYGKSAISRTIAEFYDKQDRLLGNFFFRRGYDDQQHIARLIPSLSHQLYHKLPESQGSVHSAIDAIPDINALPLEAQFKKFIIDPIRAANKKRTATSILPSQGIIIIDALDECDDKNEMKVFIHAIIGIFTGRCNLGLRILITSRVEEHIRESLEAAASAVVHRRSLQDFDASADIFTFLQSRLSTVYARMPPVLRKESQWPAPKDLDSLVKKSDGSFLVATTFIKVVEAGGRPDNNLRKALTTEGGLDGLYKDIFERATRNDNFKRVIGTVVLLRGPIPVVSLAHLLALETWDIVEEAIKLQSIVKVPDNDEKPITLFHTSLRDFLIAPERSGLFFIDPPMRHLFIAADCLKVLAIRPTDDMFYGEREEYARRNWCHHIAQGVEKASGDLPSVLRHVGLTHCLMDFVKSMDVWVNTSVVKGGQQLGILRSAISKLTHVENLPEQLIELLNVVEANAMVGTLHISEYNALI
ncbi:hypothetical protein H0H81_010389 [Sphagnurus paluster]|uniref:Nephrocystin 3-like N-terminal domain-containing protein n=1 Tax=Sphagnurus paluster TaxID=117069 RepID=A0A9P7GQ52_9AGAR|nr:hypothetical protein H0H81_010389 [Sphagnurus paluster]